MKKFLLIFLFTSSLLFSEIFLGVNLEGEKITEKTLQATKEEVNFPIGFVNFFLRWPRFFEKPFFPKDTLFMIWHMGAVPCITWEPMTYDNKVIFFEEIIKGEYDDYIDFFARELKKWGKPVILRFAHEMNLSSYHWGVKLEDYNENYPGLYQKAFRYVVSIFKKEGAENVFFAFCPNADAAPREKWNTLKNYYPGDRYVDILGLDGYNFDGRSFEDIFSSSFHEMKAINDKMPFFIFETAGAENKKVWIDEALKVSKIWDINAFLWFQINKEKNWKITKKEKDAFKDFKAFSSQNWIKEEYEKKRSFKIDRKSDFD